MSRHRHFHRGVKRHFGTSRHLHRKRHSATSLRPKHLEGKRHFEPISSHRKTIFSETMHHQGDQGTTFFVANLPGIVTKAFAVIADLAVIVFSVANHRIEAVRLSKKAFVISHHETIRHRPSRQQHHHLYGRDPSKVLGIR